MIHISQAKINSWITCERQFQLRYVCRDGWPEAPNAADSVEAMALGELFHALVAQKILLKERFTPPDFSSNPTLSSWWRNFETFAPKTQTADRYRVESKLTAAINSQVKLIGRIDLLVYGAHALKIYDWKTGRPQPQSELEQDWQTRIYMGLLYRSRQTLCGTNIPPSQISMTYWYTRDPEKSVTLRFDDAWHTQNWQEIESLAAQISNRLAETLDIWPLTADLDHCGRCTFSTLCDRHQPNPDSQATAIDLEQIDDTPLLETVVHPDL